MSYGSCFVTIPASHKIGEIDAPIIGFGDNKEKYMTLDDLNQKTKQDFFKDLSERINKSPKKSAFIFIHGYNVSFEAAAKRTAQIYFDLKFRGAPVFYSWPSQDNIGDYIKDETNIDWTQDHLEEFLKDFLKNSKAEEIYIIAHSMGTRAMTLAISSVVKELPSVKNKIKEVILAAPDIDADKFKGSPSKKLKESCKRVTIYGSATDRAILISKLVHGYTGLSHKKGQVS